MVLDTLSGRTPLYRLERFFQEKDTELLLGQPVEPGLFGDHNVARVLDKIFDTGPQKIFFNIAQNAISAFEIDPRRVHFDTTSITVFGDYEGYEEPFQIDYGYSKDKRPDLKQFLVSMLKQDKVSDTPSGHLQRMRSSHRNRCLCRCMDPDRHTQRHECDRKAPGGCLPWI